VVLFLQAGISVVIADRTDSADLAASLDKVAPNGAKAVYIHCDIANEDSINNLVTEAHKQLGK
jgi:NAD(P)-dependent dehydrogenase (short-subunit alcohol dehydrogenase family)